jgi:hypothetical protein
VIDRLLAGMDNPEPWVGAVHGERILMGEWVFNLPREGLVRELKAIGMPKASVPPPGEMAALHVVYREVALRVAELMVLPYCRSVAPLGEALAKLNTPRARNLLQPLLPAFKACALRLGELLSPPSLKCPISGDFTGP